ncbi:MAG: hypothetical protein HYY23_17360 [Verrucomicrobia bacterium]|nr:hypothetical protein [Verrucomicrobiota bacterium]
MKTNSLIHGLCSGATLTGGIAVVATLCACCAPAHIVSSAGDTAAGAVKGAGKTAASATRAASKTAASAAGTAGKVVHSSVTAAGQVAKATVGAAADVVTAPFVLFKDARTGKSCRVPWHEGMTLVSALKEAGVKTELDTVSLLRGADSFKPGDSFALRPGDVVELTAKGGVPALVQAGAL